MSNFMKSYTLNDGAVTYIIEARNATFNPDTLFISTCTRGPGVAHTNDVYVSRKDAIDFAWSVLENYGVAERPPTPLVVGDFVVTNDGRVGRIVDIDVNEPALYVEGPYINPNWQYTHETHRITKEEFVKKSLAKAAEKVNTFVEEG